MIKDIRLHLDMLFERKVLELLLPYIAGVPRLEISVARFSVAEKRAHGERRAGVEKACRVIIEGRSGKETLWDDGGDLYTVRMLESIIPGGYREYTRARRARECLRVTSP